MTNMKRLLATVATSFIASFALAAYSFAGAWVQDINGYRYQNDDGTFKQNEWVQDTDKRWFYLGDNGYMLCDQWIFGIAVNICSIPAHSHSKKQSFRR